VQTEQTHVPFQIVLSTSLETQTWYCFLWVMAISLLTSIYTVLMREILSWLNLLMPTSLKHLVSVNKGPLTISWQFGDQERAILHLV
jgi:hypothetical protein